MLDNIYHFFLAFSNETVIIPLIIIGYIWFNKKVFFHGISLLLISTLFNFALKISFQMPLSPAVGKGFAFPSGHMQSALVLYGWMYKCINEFVIRLLIVILLSGIGAGLVHFGYHSYFDVCGAMFFGILLMLAYSWMSNKYGERALFLVVLLFGTLLMLYIEMFYTLNSHLWRCYYALLGFILAENYCKAKRISSGLKNKIISTIFCFFVIIIIHTLFSFILLPAFLLQLQWLFIGSTIPISLIVTSYISSKEVLHDK